MTQQHGVPLRNSGASTADWIGQTKGRAIYAYDLAALAGESLETKGFTKEDFEDALRKVSRKRRIPLGENIRDTIQSLRGAKD